MRAIFVHGASARPNHGDYVTSLNRRRFLFRNLVAAPLGFALSQFGDSPWGNLRPLVQVPLGFNRNTLESLGREVSGDSDSLDWRHHIESDGRLNVATFLEAAVLRATHLSHQDLLRLTEHVLSLSEQNKSLAAPEATSSPSDVMTELVASYPLPRDAFEAMDDRTGVLRSVLEGLKRQLATLNTTPRDLVVRHMAALWFDNLWYFGPARDTVQEHVINAWDQQTKDSNNELTVILAHSLGGTISFEALNSDRFLDLKLNERGPWALIMLGAQLPLYQQLGIVANRGLRSELRNTVCIYNIVDRHDPLAVPLGDEKVDILTRSGISIFNSHTSYLDSGLVLQEVRRCLLSFTKTQDEYNARGGQ